MRRLLFLFAYLLTSSMSGQEESRRQTFQLLYKEQIARLPYLKKKNPKLLILFSGTPGMGKSTVAQALEHHFRGIRISSDDLRFLARDLHLNKTYLTGYSRWSLKKLIQESPNHLIILDRSIDRSYNSFLLLAKKYNFKTFLIRLYADRDVVAERIRSRGRDTEMLIEGMERSWKAYEEFGRRYTADFVFDNRGNFQDNFQELLRMFDFVEPI